MFLFPQKNIISRIKRCIIQFINVFKNPPQNSVEFRKFILVLQQKEITAGLISVKGLDKVLTFA